LLLPAHRKFFKHHHF
jgi:APA family basic amino acid/polyamine antiporter